MSTSGLKSNTGSASWAARNYYGFRSHITGELLPITRPLGSISAALDFLYSLGAKKAWEYDVVNLAADTEARAAYIALGIKGIPAAWRQ